MEIHKAGIHLGGGEGRWRKGGGKVGGTNMANLSSGNACPPKPPSSPFHPSLIKKKRIKKKKSIIFSLLLLTLPIFPPFLLPSHLLYPEVSLPRVPLTIYFSLLPSSHSLFLYLFHLFLSYLFTSLFLPSHSSSLSTLSFMYTLNISLSLTILLSHYLLPPFPSLLPPFPPSSLTFPPPPCPVPSLHLTSPHHNLQPEHRWVKGHTNRNQK